MEEMGDVSLSYFVAKLQRAFWRIRHIVPYGSSTAAVIIDS
jgi:hypothetical protein